MYTLGEKFANFNEFYNVNEFNRILQLQNEILISRKNVTIHITYYCKLLAFTVLHRGYSEVKWTTESETTAEERD